MPFDNPEIVETWIARYGEQLVDAAINLAAALAILLIGFWAAGAAGRAVRRLARRSPQVDETLGAVAAWVVRWVIGAAVILAVLHRFGVETTSIVAVLGAATLAIGLALQGTLSNFAAGVMLVLFRPYRIGDFVELAGRAGSVRDINLFTTELVSIDRVRLVLPNGQCWGAPIVNFSAYPTRRVDIEIFLPYEIDLDAALRTMLSIARGDARILPEPAPETGVKRLSETTIVVEARLWCAGGEYLAVRSDMLARFKAALIHSAPTPIGDALARN